MDYTSKGILWDPVLNYCCAQWDCATEIFTPLSAALPTATSTAAPPAPGATPTPQPPTSSEHPYTMTPEEFAHCTRITPDQVITVLSFKGKWGNSFSDIRKTKEETGLHKMAGEALAFMKGTDAKKESHSLSQKLSMLRWAEGPLGPRWKSLERKGATWNTTALLPSLV